MSEHYMTGLVVKLLGHPLLGRLMNNLSHCFQHGLITFPRKMGSKSCFRSCLPPCGNTYLNVPDQQTAKKLCFLDTVKLVDDQLISST